MVSHEEMAASAPLAGRHVVITRPAEQAADFAALLAAEGALVTTLSSIGIAPLDDPTRLDAALRELSTYDWAVLTSANGVRAVDERLRSLGLNWDARGAAKLAVIGPATARALAGVGAAADYMPDEYVAEAIAGGLGSVAGRRILLLRADIARRSLAAELRARGAEVDEVAAYRTVVLPPEPERVRAVFGARAPAVDVVTFTSSATVRGFVDGLARADLDARDALRGAVLAAIGPITAETLREYGFEAAVVADEYTMPGLARALARYFAPPVEQRGEM